MGIVCSKTKAILPPQAVSQFVMWSLGTYRGHLRIAPLRRESFTFCFCPWSRGLCGRGGVQLNWC